jgi:predicted TPR repeat methyltransferase
VSFAELALNFEFPRFTRSALGEANVRLFQHSSGNVVADKRAGYAEAAARDLDFGTAADVMAQALELVPRWTAGWALLGKYCEGAGDLAGAIAAFEELARLDSEGVFGAGLKLASLGVLPVPPGPEIVYVEALFDDYAGRFEEELLHKLGYEAPQGLASLLARELQGRGLEQVGHAVDLGCGTGLMGERLRRRASYLEGVDLSGEMVAMAERKGIYDRLEKAELTAWLGAHQGGVDLLAAADVLNYCGELAPVLRAAMRVLVPGGLFALTLERHRGEAPMLLQASLRFAHNGDAARQACRDAGFEVLAVEETVLRHDRGEPIEGLLVLLGKPAATLPILPLVDEEEIAGVRIDG